jgi:hypothetical protein
MKKNLSIFIFLLTNILLCQSSSNFVTTNNLSYGNMFSKAKTIGTNGYNFELLDAGVNSEFGYGFFKNKLIMVSSKKLGGFAKIDPNTNEAYKDLELLTIEHVIEEINNELRIVIDNIYFDFAKSIVKEESHVSLNKIIKVLQ